MRDREREIYEERERDGEREKMWWKLRYSFSDPNYGILLGICPSLIKHYQKKDKKVLPKVSMTQKSMLYRDTAYLKKL